MRADLDAFDGMIAYGRRQAGRYFDANGSAGMPEWPEQLAALIAEVRALREVAEAIIDYGDHHAKYAPGGACKVCAALARLEVGK